VHRAWCGGKLNPSREIYPAPGSPLPPLSLPLKLEKVHETVAPVSVSLNGLDFILIGPQPG
jgi:hypothetical protein